jgi:hypothetical protein
MNTSAPHNRAATAWFAPFPPNPKSNFGANSVSPGLGNLSVKVVRSILALPITAMRGRLAIYGFPVQNRRESSQATRSMSTLALSHAITPHCNHIFCHSELSEEPAVLLVARKSRFLAALGMTK